DHARRRRRHDPDGQLLHPQDGQDRRLMSTISLITVIGGLVAAVGAAITVLAFKAPAPTDADRAVERLDAYPRVQPPLTLSPAGPGRRRADLRPDRRRRDRPDHVPAPEAPPGLPGQEGEAGDPRQPARRDGPDERVRRIWPHLRGRHGEGRRPLPQPPGPRVR